MVQKVIRIGTSTGVTIPKKELQRLGIGVGDEIDIVFKPHKNTRLNKFSNDVDKFMDMYQEDLKNLAKR